MFRLLPTTKCKRQQIAILIISFFAYVAGIRNENNNMLLQQQQQQLLQQQQHMTIENSNYKSSLASNQNPVTDIKQQTNSDFRPSPIIDFTTADATVPQLYKPTYIDGKYTISNTATFNTNTQQKQQQQLQIQQNDDNRRYTTTTYGNTAEKQFSFPNEQQQESLQQQQQQQIPQLTDRPIYIYRDPYTNENYHYTPTEPIIIQDTTASTPPYNHNNYNGNSNGNGYKQQEHSHHDNQEYLVQSSMIVGTQQQQLQQHPYMSLSDDKDVYLKRPGLVYDEKTGYKHPNSVIDKKIGEVQTVKANKISYDSHDYPPPSYFQQQTSNFLPTPVPDIVKPKLTPRPVPRPTSPPRQYYRPPSSTPSQLFGHQQQQYLQSSQSSLPNYANNIDNYLPNKQQADYYRTETPPHTYGPHKQRYETIPPFGVQQQQYESRPPPSYQQQKYESRPPPFYQQQEYESSPPPSYQQQYESSRPPPYQYNQQQYESKPPPYQQQYESRPPFYNQVVPQQSYDPPYETIHQQQQASLQRPPVRPSYNNYYDYQIGEVPPQTQTSLPSSQNFNYPYPRPPSSQFPHQSAYRPPPVPPTQQQSGLATLATLAQYAPQFTQLFLGGGEGGTSSNTNSPLSSLIGAFTGAATSQQPSYTSSSPSSSYNRRPVNSQLIRALENIARNDDLQCVPKVLCQMIAAQTQRGQLPTFITSPAITNFLAGFPAASPALIYGRAALLGLSGGETSCHQTYAKCPKNEYEIIDYLNNHRGGFFKFFSEPEEQQHDGNNDSTQQGGASSLFSILASLTGSPQITTTTPRPTPKPQAPSADITSGIGNFFNQLLSDYTGGATVEYQRKRRTRRSVGDKIIFKDNNRDKIKFNDDDDDDDDNNKDSVNDVDEDFHDEEDNEDTQQSIEFRDENEEEEDKFKEEETYFDDNQGRILHKPGFRGKQIKFFPEIQETLTENERDQLLKVVIQKYNDYNKGRKLKFPTATDERQYLDVTKDAVRQGKDLLDLPYEHEQNYGYQYTNYVEDSYDPLHRDTKKVKFQDDNAEQEQPLYSHYIEKSEDMKTKLVFPERLGKILNNPYYAGTYTYNDISATQEQQEDKFVLPNKQRPSRYTEFPQTSSANVYNTHINSINSQHSFTSSSSINNNYYGSSSEPHKNLNNNHFLPTPPPEDTGFTSSNSIYSTNHNSNNQANYNSQYQSNNHRPQRYPANNNSNTNTNRYPSNRYTNTDRYHSSLYTTRRPHTTTTKRSDDKNIYITNSHGVTEYYVTPDGRKVYL